MNPYIQYLQEYLTEKHIDYGYSDAKTLLDMIYYAYSLNNLIDNEKIRDRFNKANKILSRLTMHDNNQLFEMISELCEEHAHLAFLAGVHVGYLLDRELQI